MKIKSLFCIGAFMTALFCVLPMTAYAQFMTSVQEPISEVFALMDPGESADSFDTFAALETVDGLAFRVLWRRLEPQNGRYDWTALDSALDAVRKRGKKLTIHIGVSGGAWPQWLQTAGMATYSYNTRFGSGTDPVPWDTVLLERHALLVSALAAHLQQRGVLPLVRAISDGAPVAEMSLVACRNGMLGNLSYTRTDYLQAWKTSVAAHARAFPSTPVFVSAPVSIICSPDRDGRAFYSDLMQYALGLGGQFAIFTADLNAQGSARMEQVEPALQQQMPVGMQTIWSAADDPRYRMAGTLRAAVCQGLAAGARYFELYKADLLSTDGGIKEAVRIARGETPCNK